MKLGAKAKYLIPGERETLRLIDYIKTRRETGVCETCDHEMKDHPRCQACGILCGTGHILSLSEYRGHELCGNCIHSWKVLERVRDKRVSFNKFVSPSTIKYEPMSRSLNKLSVEKLKELQGND